MKRKLKTKHSTKLKKSVGDTNVRLSDWLASNDDIWNNLGKINQQYFMMFLPYRAAELNRKLYILKSVLPSKTFHRLLHHFKIQLKGFLNEARFDKVSTVGTIIPISVRKNMITFDKLEITVGTLYKNFIFGTDFNFHN